MADLLQLGETGPIVLPATPLPALGPPGFEGNFINYAPVTGPRAEEPRRGVPSIAGVDARFAAVPDAPTRPEGGFSSRSDALEYANALHAHNSALKDAQKYAQTAKYIHDLHHEASQEIEAGDFLTAFGSVRHDSPDFEDQVSALLAKYPNAGGHQAVQEALSVKHAARQNNFHIANQNRQEADQEEKAIQAAGAANFLHPGDLTRPGEIHPELGLPTINENGSVNRKNLLLLAVMRQANQKTERGETAAQAADRADFALHEKQMKTIEDSDANYASSPAYVQAKAVRDALYSRIAQRDYARVIKTVPGAPGASGPIAAPAPTSASRFIIRKRTP